MTHFMQPYPRPPKPKKAQKALKRVPLKRAVAKIRPMSSKRRKQMAEYSVLRRKFLADNPVCEVFLKEGGWQKVGYGQWTTIGGTPADLQLLLEGGCPAATQVHHKRKRHGSRLNETEHWLAVSALAHERIENNKAWARERGYLYPI